MRRYKCEQCKIYTDEPICPECGIKNIPTVCKCNQPCICTKEIHETIQFCPECGEPVCPCGSNDVVAISRITGYMSDVSGWGNGKRIELKQRKRYNIN